MRYYSFILKTLSLMVGKEACKKCVTREIRSGFVVVRVKCASMIF